MKSQTTKIYSQLDEDDIKLIAALLRELGYGAEGELEHLKIFKQLTDNPEDIMAADILGYFIEVAWEHEVKDNA